MSSTELMFWKSKASSESSSPLLSTTWTGSFRRFMRIFDDWVMTWSLKLAKLTSALVDCQSSDSRSSAGRTAKRSALSSESW